MRKRDYSFEELRTVLIERLERQGCSPITITGYRYQCNGIFKWLREIGYDHYSSEGGNRLLQDYRDEHGENQYYANLRTVIYRLNDILQDTWNNVHSDKGKHFCFSGIFVEIVDRYCCWNTDTGHASGTIRNKRYAVSWFVDELFKLNCRSLEDLSPTLISQACIRITNHGLWGEIRQFLKYLAEYEGVRFDYSTIVPHYSRPYVIPSVYSVDEIRSVQDVIDTSTVLGKRDYAMFLLASRMGMRSGDIIGLRINDVQNKSELEIIQKKTGNTLHLPMIREVKLAIEDYLSVRPSTKSDLIFISVYAPYNPVTTSTLRAALRKYIGIAGIDPGNRKKGPHALRASLASSMINDDISYETVRNVLGHSSNNAIKHYARIDVEHLRRYSLTPPLPVGKFHSFLYGEVEQNGRV